MFIFIHAGIGTIASLHWAEQKNDDTAAQSAERATNPSVNRSVANCLGPFTIAASLRLQRIESVI